MNIANKIRKARQNSNLTQQEVADRLNVSRKTLSGWENNWSKPDLEMLKSLANVFGENLNYFLEIEEKRPVPKRLIWLYWINAVLFSINFIITVFTKINAIGFILVELLIVILLFTVGNQQEIKMKMKYKFLILFVIAFILFLFSINHYSKTDVFFNLGVCFGSLVRAIVLTWSFNGIVKFSKII